MFFRNPILMSTFGKRDRVTIIRDILETAKKSKVGKKKTQIIQSANLNYYQVNKYMHLLLLNGFVFMDGNDRYRITNKGLQFVKTLESLNITLK